MSVVSNTVQAQVHTAPVATALPAGWRKVTSADGQIYYQNDITKQTQWDPPASVAVHTIASAPAIQMTTNPNISSIQAENEDEYQDAAERKLWHKEHILWLFLFALNVYDYITDIQVAISFINLQNVCLQFNCAVIPNDDGDDGIAYILLFCVSLGFIANLIRQIFEVRRLYTAYKYPMSIADELEKDLRRYRRALYWNWVPLIVEDLTSLTLVYVMYLNYFQFIIGDKALYLQSLALSICSIVVGLILVFRKRIKLYKSKAHQENNAYKKPIWCHCCWCTCSGFYTGILTIMLVINATWDTEPIIDIEDPQNVIGDPDGQCWIYYENVDITMYRGDIIESPRWIYDECYGANYTYDMQCEQDIDPAEVKILHCELKWNFNGGNASECHRKDDSCLFDLNTGICQNYTINCDDFAFFDGKPVMWACFDYCRV